MANEQKALKLIERLVLIDHELTRGGMPGLYDHVERIFALADCPAAEDSRALHMYNRVGAAWYDKRIDALQIARLNHLITTNPIGTGPPILWMIEQIIRCQEEGGVMDQRMDARTLQAKRIWTASWGRYSNEASFKDYLASIPPIPDVSGDAAESFPHLMLVDARTSPKDVGFMADVRMEHDGVDWVFHKPWNDAGQRAYWLRYRSEVLYNEEKRSPTPKGYVSSLKEQERQLTLHEGLFICVHDFKERRSLPMALSGTMVDEGGSADFDRWPLIACENISSIVSTEQHELRIPSCLVPVS